ncbi:MAG TPA: threonine synthase [Vicinamibacteria bacterium]|nr:threonine synthase [Vicinamibacteria bacterium]
MKPRPAGRQAGPGFVSGLTCMRCGQRYARGLDGPCPRCGPEGVLDIEFDLASVKRSLNRRSLAGRSHHLWRYAELLPVPSQARRPPLAAGWTPLLDAPRLAAWAGVRGLILKDEGRNPTASFKDRASAVGVARALARKATVVACASTGNAASSLAGAAASVGLPAVIFVPQFAPEPKVAQLLIFGARVIRVQADYDATWEFCQRACDRYGWYNRNAAVNPSLVEGKKTCGLEIAEQTGAGVPDWVAVSVGDGCTIAGIWKGLREMHALGFIPRLPRLLAVQAQGARPLVDAFREKRDLIPGPAETLADSICVGHPRNWRKALAAVRQSGGTFIAVPDEAILEAMRVTGRLSGVFGEPAGVAGVAGLRLAVKDGIVGRRATALAVITGSGLKDVRTALKAAGEPDSLKPDDDDLAAYLKARPISGT